VAGAPVDAVVARADELARRWAIALILALPVERIGEFPLERFARQAPLLCTQVVRALQSDTELERITAGANGARERSPAGRVTEVTGAPDGSAAVEAVEALRGVVWEALLDELRLRGFDQAPATEVADLADRLAYVCSSALGSSLMRPAQAADPPVEARLTAIGVELPETLPADREPAAARSQRSPVGNGVVIVDEGQARARRAFSRADPAHRHPAGGPAGPPPAHAGARRIRARPLPWDIPLGTDGPEARDERA
jgi:hypothetical protein